MKLPRRHRIGPYNYKLIPRKAPTEESVGSCEPRISRIQVNKELSGRFLLVTIIHEDLHAAFDAIGRQDLYTDEALVDSLAGVLTGLLLDSPNYLEFLMEIRDEHK